MKTQKAFKTKINDLIKKTMFNVRAEEPKEPTKEEPTQTVNEPQQTSTNSTVNFEDLIANARRQEKDKLYPQIKKLEEEKKALVEKSNNHLLSLGEKDAKIKELETEINNLKKATTDNVSDREKALNKEIDTLKKTIANMEQEVVSVEDLENSIREEYEVKLYREQKLREVGETVIPELITGTTREEIDASLQASQERFQQITNKILGGVQVPVANVNTSTFQTKDLKIEDIANLDPRSPEYAQLRTKLGLR